MANHDMTIPDGLLPLQPGEVAYCNVVLHTEYGRQFIGLPLRNRYPVNQLLVDQYGLQLVYRIVIKMKDTRYGKPD